MKGADRMEREAGSKLGELINIRKKPSNYKFERRNPENTASWQEFFDARVVDAEAFLDLLTDYLSSAIPNTKDINTIVPKLI